MPDIVIKRGVTARLGRIEGNLKAGRNVIVKAESGNKVVVSGEAHFEGPASIECDLESQSLKVEGQGYGPGGNVRVRGDLVVHGSADIMASMDVVGKVAAEDIDVGGHLESQSLTSKRARVGGHLKVSGTTEADTLDVGGHLVVSGDVKLANLRVGGHVEIGGGSITGETDVRGHFSSARKLIYGRLRVFGQVRLPNGSDGDRLEALGKAEFEGNSACKELVIHGRATSSGSFSADDVDISGKFDVLDSLRVSKRFQVFGTAKVRRQIECGTLVVGGKLVAGSVLVSEDAELAGDIQTSRGLKAKVVMVRSGTKCGGPIVGDRVDLGSSQFVIANWASHWAGQSIVMRGIGRTTSAEDVYAREVVLGSSSRCGRIYANRVELGEGAVVEQVTYTDEIKLPVKRYIHRPPVKTERLPNPPI